MNPPTDADLQRAVTSEFLALADLLESLPESEWETPSLCAGWRVREVVAHMTMPTRYTMEQFMAELRDCGDDFIRLSNRVAERDASLSTTTLVGNLRDEVLHQWTPRGGHAGALNHVVIHGLDFTVPLGTTRQPPEETVRIVLDHLTTGGAHEYFGSDLNDVALQATDIDWSYGSGTLVKGIAADLALYLCGRQLPAGRISGPPS